jgi:hypothetical protein
MRQKAFCDAGNLRPVRGARPRLLLRQLFGERQVLDAQTIVLFISRITFHFIAAGTMLLAALLSMRLFRRDREEGMLACILSKPVTGAVHCGQGPGRMVLSAVFMFLLHGMVCVFYLHALKVFLPQYLAASLLCSLNLLSWCLPCFCCH